MADMKPPQQLPQTMTLPSDWDIELSFGQYKGQTPRNLVEVDENVLHYLLWCIDHVEFYKPSFAFCEEVRRRSVELKHNQEVSGTYRRGVVYDFDTYDYNDDNDDDDLDSLGGPDDDIPF